MRYYKVLFLIIFIFFSICIVYQMIYKSTTTMKYFPIDEESSIINPTTTLVHQTEGSDIKWTVESSSTIAAYLRQDISLLYENGVFKGLQSKWKENEQDLFQEQSIPMLNNASLQSISFHHGEIHHKDDLITSMQKMSNAMLYVIQHEDSFHTFSSPSSKQEKNWSNELSTKTNEQLQSHLDIQLTYHDILADDYLIFPLYELAQYHDSSLPGQSSETSAKIIGQFWEGFYSNYITLLMSYKEDIPPHYMPFILMAKDGTHLIALYEIENNKQQLIQRLDASLTMDVDSIQY